MIEPEHLSLVRIPVVCIIGASRSIENLPIQVWREIRPVRNARSYDRFCAAQISGDSLRDESICDGDYVIVRLNFEPHEITPGRLVAVLTPMGLLVKRIYLTLDDQVRLVSANTDYPDLLLDADSVEVQGIVVRVERDL